MAGAGNFFHFLLFLFIGFFLLPFSVMCNDVEELNQGLIKDNLTVSYNLTFPYKIASFGVPLVKGVEFHVSVASPNRKGCCGPIDPPPIRDNLTPQFWIVVIQRLDCLFVPKVRNAQDAGFDAAIIHNIGSNGLVRIDALVGDNADDIHIPAFFIGEDDGVNLTNAYFQAREQGQTLLLSMETNGYEYIYVFDYTSLILSFTHFYLFGAIILCYVIYQLIQRLVKNCSIRRPKKRLSELRTLSNSLATIPTKTFEIGDPYETCAICFKDFSKGDKLRLLHCSHAFHCKCIDPWLANHRRICPMCNQRVESQQTSVV